MQFKSKFYFCSINALQLFGGTFCCDGSKYRKSIFRRISAGITDSIQKKTRYPKITRFFFANKINYLLLAMLVLAFVVFVMFVMFEAFVADVLALLAVLLASAAVLLAAAAFLLASIAVELAFEAVELAFEAVELAFLAVLAAELLAADSQAIPMALNANKPDNAIIFFISNSPVFFKDYLDFYFKLRQDAILSQLINFLEHWTI